MQQEPSKKYHAFISYRHSDNKEQGRQWASWLHQAIETYQVPDELVGQVNSRGETIPARIFPVFRDEEELPADADLGRSIVNALDSTRLLIVLCSPRAVDSTYVADEIEYFKQLGHSDRIIAVMIDGEPNASWDLSKHSLGYSKSDECFPIPLQFEYDLKGQRLDKRAEPIAADFRVPAPLPSSIKKMQQGWASVAAYEIHLKSVVGLNKTEINSLLQKYRDQQNLMLLKIIAGILGLPLGELTQRDKEYQLIQERAKAKKLRRWLSLVASLAVIAISAGGFAFIKQQEALAQTQQAQISQSKTLAQNAMSSLSRGDYQAATEQALSGLPKSFSKPERGYSADAEAVLSSAYFHNQLILRDVGDPNWGDLDWLRKEPYKDHISKDQSRLILTGGASPVVIDLVKQQRVELQSIPKGKVWQSWVSENGKLLAGQTRQGKNFVSYIWSTKSGELLIRQNAEFSVFSDDEQYAGFQRLKLSSDSKNRMRGSKNQYVGFITEVASGKSVAEFEGKLRLIEPSFQQIMVEGKTHCTTKGMERDCFPTTRVLSFESNNPIIYLIGKISEYDSTRGIVSLSSSIEKPDYRQTTGYLDKHFFATESKGVTLWSIKRQMSVGFYPGKLEYINQSAQRLMTHYSKTNQLKLWDTASGQIIGQYSGKLLSNTDWDYQKLEQPMTINLDQGIGVILTGVNAPSNKLVEPSNNSETNDEYALGDQNLPVLWVVSLTSGKRFSQAVGDFLGTMQDGKLVSWHDNELTVDIYLSEQQHPIIRLDKSICKSKYSGGSLYPTMPQVVSDLVLFNCNGFSLLYAVNSSSPETPRVIKSTTELNWVERGEYFWGGRDRVVLQETNYWEGGAISIDPVLSIKSSGYSSFRSLLEGKYLLALAPDSQVALWNSSGDIFKPKLTQQQIELNKNYSEEVVEKFRAYGFNWKKIISQKQQPVISAGGDDFADQRFVTDNLVQKNSVIANLDKTATNYLELVKNQLVISYSQTHAKLVDLQNKNIIATLFQGQDYAESFFYSFEHPTGASVSPDGDAFVFYNEFGMWLFNLQGDKLASLCDNQGNCQFKIDFEWIEGQQKLISISEHPFVVSSKSGEVYSLCRSFSELQHCRAAFSGPLLVSKGYMTSGRFVFDLNTGVKLVELQSQLQGMPARPVAFSEDQNYLLMEAESGGGMFVFGVWQLPLRGQQLLEKVHQ
jgi:hypothetical protein